MDEGKIDAQGTFEELQEHPYMKEILDIHAKNKVQAPTNVEEELSEDKVNLLRQVSSYADGSSASSVASLKSEKSIEVAIKPTVTQSDGSGIMSTIAGVQNQIDENTQSTIGKLLVAEEDEDVSPNAETWATLRTMVGGSTYILIFLAFHVFRRFTWHNQGMNEGGLFTQTEEEQRANW